MCAIAGCLHFKNKGSFSLQPLLESMKHRGPDETAFIEEEFWSIGVNRLAITSAKEKNTQPLWSLDKRFCFVFNGEIYNYKEVKKNLKDKNYKFKTSCDAEVLFYAFLEYKTEAFLKCQGMFACALFDTLEKKWILARDPFGIKPLYFHTSKERFIFSSEIKALLLLQKEPEINRKVLPSYLRKRFVMGEETLFSGIFRLQPGELMEAPLTKKIRQIKYWKAPIKLKSKVPQGDLKKSFYDNFHRKAERYKEFASKLKKSIRISSESETGKAILLSGGLDSSLINVVSCFGHKNSFKNRDLPSAWFF